MRRNLHASGSASFRAERANRLPERQDGGKARKRPGPVEPMPDAEIPTPSETAEAEDIEVAAEDAGTAAAEDDTVLVEQDGDDADVAELVELDVEDPKEG